MLDSRPFPAAPAPSTAPASVGLLDVLPDLRAAVPPADLTLARRVLRAPVHELTPREDVTARWGAAKSPFAAVLVSGLVLRRTTVSDRSTAELLGPGDLVDLRVEHDSWTMHAPTICTAHGIAELAPLDDRFRLAARRWPALLDVVTVQLQRQMRFASRHLAMLALPRVEDRLVMLLSDAADRWGHVTPDGVVVELPSTHTQLGELVGSRRPTVSLALTELAAAGRVTRLDGHRWQLSPAAAPVAV